MEKYMRVHIYEDMLILVYGNLTKSHKESINSNLQWFLDYGLNKWEAKWRCQLSWNHVHCGSRQEAVKYIKQIKTLINNKLPRFAGRLKFSWREPVKKEKGNAVNLSFYIDRETLGKHPSI